MLLTIFNRIDISFYSEFRSVSLGFNIHRGGIDLSFIFFELSIHYMSPARRERLRQRSQELLDEIYGEE